MNPLSKVFAILEAVVAKQETGATYSDILARLDLPKSTVHRLLKDLVDIGYITYDLESRRYTGSFRLAQLGSEVISKFQLRKHVRPFLNDLHWATEHTSNLGILDGTRGVFIDKIEARDFGIKLFSELGKTFPLHCTGMGKIFLAYAGEKLFRQLTESPLEPVTDQTITDPELLQQELSRIRNQGYALDNEEITRGIICVAGPIFDYHQELIAAISVAFPAYIEKDRGLQKEIEAIKKFSALISKSLGAN